MLRFYYEITSAFTKRAIYIILSTLIIVNFINTAANQKTTLIPIIWLVIELGLLIPLYQLAKFLNKKIMNRIYLNDDYFDFIVKHQGQPAMATVNKLDKMMVEPARNYPGSVNDLKVGFIQHQINDEMKIGVIERIKTEIAFDGNLLQHNATSSIPEEIHLSKKMKAKLLSTDGFFEIISLNSETQVVLNNDKTSWNWDVKPLKSGNSVLELVLSVAINVKGIGLEMKDLDTYSKKVLIHVNPVYTVKHFLTKNYQWIIGTVCGSGILFALLKAFKVIT
ncbi:hypothetical protein [Mucilaginibacter pineti]|nr:hypothetical protein [Mucilaginibacter pineti]